MGSHGRYSEARCSRTGLVLDARPGDHRLSDDPCRGTVEHAGWRLTLRDRIHSRERASARPAHRRTPGIARVDGDWAGTPLVDVLEARASACRAPAALIEPGCMARTGPFIPLLADGSVRRDRQGITGLIAVPWRCCVLDQPDLVRKDVSRHRARGVFITRVLVVDTERHARADGHIVERDLVPVRWNWLQRYSLEAAPAGMDVSRADAVDARLRRRWQIGSSRRRSQKHKAEGGERGAWSGR